MSLVKAMPVVNSSDILYGLSGDLWPIHLKPKSDELLSSWLVRLAHANGYKVETFCCLLFGYRSTIWNRDIDRAAPDNIGAILSSITGATSEQILNTTFVSYEGKLFSQVNHHGVTRWILPLGIYHRARKRPALMYCPACLARDETPYFRKQWRLAFSTVCTIHECLLLDICPRCYASVAPHRVDMLNRCYLISPDLNVHCCSCEYDLRNTRATPVNDPDLVHFQLELECILKEGFVAWCDNPSLYSVIYFDGLKALIAGLTSSHSIKRLISNGDFKHKEIFEDWPTAGLEFSNINTRRIVFHWLATLINGWPGSLSNLLNQYGLRYCDLKGSGWDRPFWYENVIRR